MNDLIAHLNRILLTWSIRKNDIELEKGRISKEIRDDKILTYILSPHINVTVTTTRRLQGLLKSTVMHFQTWVTVTTIHQDFFYGKKNFI